MRRSAGALDAQPRRALLPIYPEIRDVGAAASEMRILNAPGGTGADTRVLIESRAIGASSNVIEAPRQALPGGYVDGVLHAPRT